jgi:hypothetical protein
MVCRYRYPRRAVRRSVRPATPVALRAFLCFALGLLAAEGARAQTEAAGADAQPVVLGVRVVHAMKAQGEIGPGCEDMLKRLPMDFGALELVQSQEFELKVGQRMQFALPSGRTVRMLPVAIQGRQLHLHFEMSGIMNTRLRMLSGRPMIVGGEPHRGGQLIVEVTPSFHSGPGSAPIRRPKQPKVQRVGGSEPD